MKLIQEIREQQQLEQHNVWSVWPANVSCTVSAGGKDVLFALACNDEQSEQCHVQDS